MIPIDMWATMKGKLMKKIVTSFYRDCLLDKLSRLRQQSLSVREYMTTFDDLTVRYDITEDPQRSLFRFRTSLRSNIQCEMLPHYVNSFEEAFQLASDIETYLRAPS